MKNFAIKCDFKKAMSDAHCLFTKKDMATFLNKHPLLQKNGDQTTYSFKDIPEIGEVISIATTYMHVAEGYKIDTEYGYYTDAYRVEPEIRSIGYQRYTYKLMTAELVDNIIKAVHTAALEAQKQHRRAMVEWNKYLITQEAEQDLCST